MSVSIVFMGPVGAGKTQAIRTISDIDPLDTDEQASDDTQWLKPTTTVSMDVGTLQLGEHDKLRLLGSPGQERFDFMWDILLAQAKGVVLVINHSRPDPVADLADYLRAVESRAGDVALPLVVAVTHTDLMPARALHIYQHYLDQRPQTAHRIPVLAMDARDPWQVQVILIAMTALLEMGGRCGKAAGGRLQ